MHPNNGSKSAEVRRLFIIWGAHSDADRILIQAPNEAFTLIRQLLRLWTDIWDSLAAVLLILQHHIGGSEWFISGLLKSFQDCSYFRVVSHFPAHAPTQTISKRLWQNHKNVLSAAPSASCVEKPQLTFFHQDFKKMHPLFCCSLSNTLAFSRTCPNTHTLFKSPD